MPRLDIFLAQNGFASTRSAAQNLIKMKKVKINGEYPTKSGVEVRESDNIEVVNDIKASIGCYKLEHAVKFFNLSQNIKNKVCMDVGASNGGFTYVLLECGATKIFAVDIGENMLCGELTNNEKVVIRDTTNAKTMPYEVIGEKVDVITVDVSFISLRKILPNLVQFLKIDSIIIALLKPQFEVGAANLTKSGIVRNDKLYDKLITEYSDFLGSLGLKLYGVTPIPKLFEKKNTEFLLFIKAI